MAGQPIDSVIIGAHMSGSTSSWWPINVSPGAGVGNIQRWSTLDATM
jgi:hypothetical protein